MPKVSIIIPLHNAEAYIRETIESCLLQSHQDLEVIVVENGSTDTSYQQVAALKDARLQLFKIEAANAGAARNYGYHWAKGSFIMFLDADDILAETKIEAQLAALAQKPAGWIASCPWAKFYDDVTKAHIEPQAVWQVENPIEWCVNAWTGAGMMVPGCWLIPKAIIEKAGLWDERLSLHDDGEFMCRVLLASKGNCFVKDTKVYYRQVHTSLSRQNQSLKAAQSALAVCQSYERAILAQEDSSRTRQALAYNYRSFMYQYHPNYKVLIKEAQTHVNQLGVKVLPLVGGVRFKQLSKIIGFENALRLRAWGHGFKIRIKINSH